jgi:hypothetical protein
MTEIIPRLVMAKEFYLLCDLDRLIYCLYKVPIDSYYLYILKTYPEFLLGQKSCRPILAWSGESGSTYENGPLYGLFPLARLGSLG